MSKIIIHFCIIEYITRHLLRHLNIKNDGPFYKPITGVFVEDHSVKNLVFKT